MNQPKTSKAEATPRPWRVPVSHATQIHALRKFVVADLYCATDALTIDATANAALIVKAVNEYDAHRTLEDVAHSAADWLTEALEGTDQYERGKAILDTLSALAALRAKEGK